MTDSLEAIYLERHPTLKRLTERLERHLRELVREYPRIDRVVARAKSPESFIAKAGKQEHGAPKYTEPIAQIQDQIGARIVTYYLQDVEKVREIVGEYLSRIEEKAVVPESFREFGYEGYHFILFIPEDVFEDDIDRNQCPTFFELQIKTLFQHAWGEADHDLSYKPSSTLRADERRRVAFTAAQAWGADYLFAELAHELGVHDALPNPTSQGP